MFGGGEEFFQPPPPIDRDTLQCFSKFCHRLRTIEKPGKETINAAAALARTVGDSEEAYEMVVGAIFRHIKSWSGLKQLACWYILDKLCKEDRDKYGHAASKYILEIGRDYLPYEDPKLGPKYESLVEHWESVFPRHVVEALWYAKKDRIWAVEHPDELLAQRAEEERQWEAEERAVQDEDGLNNFGQPCMDYLQGRCLWGSSCRLYHPPGEEGSLPPECRAGDWKCSSCGVINRHFRRRCSNCVQEKRQYKKTRALAPEDVALSVPDPAVFEALREQFGYNPYDADEAVASWRLRMDGVSLDEYLAERRAAYRVRILRRPATTELEERCGSTKHFPDVDIGLDRDYVLRLAGGSGGAADEVVGRKAPRREAPAGRGAEGAAAAAESIALLSRTITERGVRDPASASLFTELAKQLRILAECNSSSSASSSGAMTEAQGQMLLGACRLGLVAWSAAPSSVPFVATLFSLIRHIEANLGIPPGVLEKLKPMLEQVSAAGSTA